MQAMPKFIMLEKKAPALLVQEHLEARDLLLEYMARNSDFFGLGKGEVAVWQIPIADVYGSLILPDQVHSDANDANGFGMLLRRNDLMDSKVFDREFDFVVVPQFQFFDNKIKIFPKSNHLACSFVKDTHARPIHGEAVFRAINGVSDIVSMVKKAIEGAE